ncbi:hypothetical protein RJ640_010083 [Escallonia rubra]|uniref:Ycf2 N-terminal domain-containing protein n=1 Tax=Escallonia rubra TaxID=112253 RepID=A0AA88R0V4_9ASTE|nr:hypothetical protein RJ640_010083 [Escallonia rubra]
MIERDTNAKRQNIINLNSGPLFEILVKHWICYLMSAFREKIPIEVEGFFKQQGAGSTIQSNDIEHVSHLFSRNEWAISLQNCAQFHMWQFRQDLFVSWGKNPPESDFLRNVSRDNLIWLDNVWLVNKNKDRFFSKVRNVSSNIQYDSTRSSFGQSTIRDISVSPRNGMMSERIFIQTLIGHVVADDIYMGPRCIASRNQDIGIGLVNRFITTFQAQPIFIQTPFTYRSTSWICRFCYGRSPTHGDLVELGEANGFNKFLPITTSTE